MQLLVWTINQNVLSKQKLHRYFLFRACQVATILQAENFFFLNQNYHSALHSTKNLRIICSSAVIVPFFIGMFHKSLQQLPWWVVIAGSFHPMSPLAAGCRVKPLLPSVILQLIHLFSDVFLKYFRKATRSHGFSCYAPKVLCCLQSVAHFIFNCYILRHLTFTRPLPC